MTLGGAAGHGLRVACERGADGGVADHEAGARQPGDERLRVVEAGVLPDGVVEAEPAAGGVREVGVSAVAHGGRRVVREPGADRQPEADPLGIGRTVRRCRPRFRPADGQPDLPAVAGDDQLAVVRGDGEEGAGAVAVAGRDARSMKGEAGGRSSNT